MKNIVLLNQDIAEEDVSVDTPIFIKRDNRLVGMIIQLTGGTWRAYTGNRYSMFKDYESRRELITFLLLKEYTLSIQN